MTSRIIFIFIGLLLAGAALFATEKKKQGPLFRISDHGKTGFIDSKGKVVIEPKFQVAGDFSEGLAPARINGTYGFIDETGNFVIKPQFDYATFFREGMAIVYVDGQPFYINKKGEKAFDCNYKYLGTFHSGRAQISTGEHQGIINKMGRLAIDTVFSAIHPFIDGLAVVIKADKILDGDVESTKLEAAVIDTNGNFIVPFGRYPQIGDLQEGYFNAEVPSRTWSRMRGNVIGSDFLDRNGKVVFSRTDTNNSYMDGDVHCGLAKVSLYKYWIPEESGTSYSSDKGYGGYVNQKGELAISDTGYKYVNDFCDNRAFVQDDDFHFSVIDVRGKVIANKKYGRFIEPGFKNGIAFVQVADKWGAIDTNAAYIIPPKYDGINDAGLIGDYFFFEMEENDTEDSRLTGVAGLDGKILIKPAMQQADNAGFINGLLKCIAGNRLTYFNRKGKIVWQEQQHKPAGLTDLNIDFMNRGYFYARSKNYSTDFGGYGGSSNEQKEQVSSGGMPDTGLWLAVRPNMPDTFGHSFNGITAVLTNASEKEVLFNAQDSRLYMNVQALDRHNNWRDIEYLPSSWCGNSYHTMTLEPKHYWTFTTPVYQGEFKTKLRVKLEYVVEKDKDGLRSKDKTKVIYSNEYDGSVNPGQFWRKQDYHPDGIMDPYND